MPDYALDVTFRCRRLTQDQGRQLWATAEHFAAVVGPHKDGDITVYRYQTRTTAPRYALAISDTTSTIYAVANDDGLRILDLSLHQEEDR